MSNKPWVRHDHPVPGHYIDAPCDFGVEVTKRRDIESSVTRA